MPTMIIVELLFLAAAYWFGPRKYRLSFAALGLRKVDRVSWPLAGAIALASLAVVYGYDLALSALGVAAESTPEQVFDDVGPFLVVAVGAVLLAPVMEEIFFRGFVFGGLWQRRGWAVAVVISSLLFSVAHLSLYGLPVYAAIGFLLAWTYRQSGSIKSSIAAHGMINTVTVGIGLLTSF